MNRLASLLFTIPLIAGCTEGSLTLHPAPIPNQTDAAADVAADAPPDVASDSSDSAVPLKRTISQRDPFGNVAASGNLVTDGDFEWSGPYTEQYSWMSGSTGAEITIATGTTCRSGLRCGIATPGDTAIGLSVRSEGDLAVSLWIKPPKGATCGVASVGVMSCMAGTDEMAIDFADFSPDASGWCQISGVVAAPAGVPCVYVSVDSSATDTVIVDDVVMLPAASGDAGSNAYSYSLPRPEVVAKLNQARKVVAAYMQPKPPNSFKLPKIGNARRRMP